MLMAEGSPAKSSDPFSETVLYRVRFDESDPGGVLRASSLLRYAQDCAWIHSERLGFDRAWYSARGLWWLVRCADLQVLGDIPMGETVRVTTTVVGSRKVWARRQTDVTGTTGQPVASVITDWVITDERGAPTRVPREFFELFGSRVQTFTPGRVLLPPTPTSAFRHPVPVRRQDLDPMGHVNNAAYIDFLEEGVIAAGAGPWLQRLPRRYRLEYVAAAGPRDILTGEFWVRGEAGLAYRLVGPTGGEVLRATLDAEPSAAGAHAAFRETVRLRRPLHAPGKDSGPG
jgi:acyl-CoA thioesterase FadM